MITLAEPLEPELDGMPPAVQAPAPAVVHPHPRADRFAEVALIGALLLPAELRVSAQGVLQLSVLIEQHQLDRPFVAPIAAVLEHRGLSIEAMQALHRELAERAHELRAGVDVLVRGRGLQITQARDGAPLLRLLECLHIESAESALSRQPNGDAPCSSTPT